MSKDGTRPLANQHGDGAYDLATPVPGRELDGRVAREVLGIVWDENRCRVCGWRLVSEGAPLGCSPDNCSMRPRPTRCADEPIGYSRFIAAAWIVVEYMHKSGWKVDVQNRASGWACHVTFPAPDYRHIYEPNETAPLAICLAALAAVDARAAAPGRADD